MNMRIDCLKTRLILAVLILWGLVDPVAGVEWHWAKQSGGDGELGKGQSLVVDASNHVYVTGSFYSSTMTLGGSQLTNNGTNGYSDVYLAKLDTLGNVLWARQANGDSNDDGRGIAVDRNGQVYIVGTFLSPTLSFGALTITNSTLGTDDLTVTNDVFLAKYDAVGNVLWARSGGGNSFENGWSVATDSSGNVYITGSFWSPTATFGHLTLANRGVRNIFLVKYDSTGQVLWAKQAGGTAADAGISVATDNEGFVYVTGFVSSPAPVFDTVTLASQGSFDIYLAKYDSQGSVVWAKAMGGTGEEGATCVATDGSGNVFLTGDFYSPTVAFGSITLTNNSLNSRTNDLFVAKYDRNGNPLWAKGGGGSHSDEGRGITADAAGNAYVVGHYYSQPAIFDGQVLTNYYNPNLFLNSDIAVVKYDPTGSVVWAKKAGGFSYDFGESIGVDAEGNCYVTGQFNAGYAFFGDNTLVYHGNLDQFTAKLGGDELLILQQPQSQTAELGATVQLSVVASGPGPFKYQWQKEASPVGGGTNATLVLTNVTLNESGSYRVAISNALSTVTSTPAQLTVLSTPTAPVLSIALSNRLPVLRLEGQAGRAYSLEYAPTLTTTTQWTALTNLTLNGTVAVWQEPEANRPPRRFYRAVLRP